MLMNGALCNTAMWSTHGRTGSSSAWTTRPKRAVSSASTSASAPQRCRRRRESRAAAAAAADVFVLDFDGVLVDSEPEVSMSAFTAARDYWPDVFAGAGAAAADAGGEQQQHQQQQQRDRVLRGLKACRPVLVRGYESMVMARLLLERPGCEPDILGRWEALLPEALRAWGDLDWRDLQRAFEEHRAGWMDRDRAGWLACNKPYAGVVAAVRACEAPFYIASSKAAHRVAALCDEALGIEGLDPRSPRLFASLIPPNEKKVEALRAIASRPVAQGAARLHFVDDRLETLRAAAEAGLVEEGWRLYLAKWGYCTEEEKLEAEGLPYVQSLELEEFLELLKWGLVMSGVTDGCEPTAEEVAEGVKGGGGGGGGGASGR